MIKKPLLSTKTVHDSTAALAVRSFFHDFIPLYRLKERNRAILGRSYCIRCNIRVPEVAHFERMNFLDFKMTLNLNK